MTFAFWAALIVMIGGALGTLLPVLPGTPLIFIAALGYGFYDKFNHITPSILVILFILMLLAFTVDYLAGTVGAKKYGATKYGTWGSFIGGVAGVIFLNIPGLIIGPFLGAVIGEILAGKKPEEALKVGFGTMIGLAGGAVLKLILAISMVGVFVTSVI